MVTLYSILQATGTVFHVTPRLAVSGVSPASYYRYSGIQLVDMSIEVGWQ